MESDVPHGDVQPLEGTCDGSCGRNPTSEAWCGRCHCRVTSPEVRHPDMADAQAAAGVRPSRWSEELGTSRRRGCE